MKPKTIKKMIRLLINVEKLSLFVLKEEVQLMEQVDGQKAFHSNSPNRDNGSFFAHPVGR